MPATRAQREGPVERSMSPQPLWSKVEPARPLHTSTSTRTPRSLSTYVIVQGATDVSPIDGRHEGEVLPVLALQVIEVLVPGGAVPGDKPSMWGSGHLPDTPREGRSAQIPALPARARPRSPRMSCGDCQAVRWMGGGGRGQPCLEGYPGVPSRQLSGHGAPRSDHTPGPQEPEEGPGF